MPFVPHHLEVCAPGVTPARAALVVHGILGSAANWRSFVRKLVDTDPVAATFRWVLVDLRNHGDSLGAPPPHTVRACAEDLSALEQALGLPFALSFGHSFGGKVALAHAALAPALQGVWVLDTPLGLEPVDDPLARSEVGRVMALLDTIPEPLPGRAELQARLEAAGLSRALAQWMTTNVRGTADTGYRWRFDLGGCKALIADYFALDAWPIARALAHRMAVHCVRGGRSDRFSVVELAQLEASPFIASHLLPSAGHWLHVDDPDGLRGLFAQAVRGASMAG